MSDMSVTQVHWKPRLLRLTHVGLRGIDGGKETPCYVRDPEKPRPV